MNRLSRRAALVTGLIVMPAVGQGCAAVHSGGTPPPGCTQPFGAGDFIRFRLTVQDSSQMLGRIPIEGTVLDLSPDALTVRLERPVRHELRVPAQGTCCVTRVVDLSGDMVVALSDVTDLEVRTARARRGRDARVALVAGALVAGGLYLTADDDPYGELFAGALGLAVALSGGLVALLQFDTWEEVTLPIQAQCPPVR